MKVVWFNDGWFETKGSAKNVYADIAEKIELGYDKSKFSIFEENPDLTTFNEYFESGEEIEFEDLMYDYE